jgi:hypothetical protein
MCFLAGIGTALLVLTTFSFVATRDDSLALVLPKGAYGLFETMIVFLIIGAVGIILMGAIAMTTKGTVYPVDDDETILAAKATAGVAAASSASEHADDFGRALDVEESEQVSVSMPQPTQAAPDDSGPTDQGRAGSPHGPGGGSDRSRQPTGAGQRSQPASNPGSSTEDEEDDDVLETVGVEPRKR